MGANADKGRPMELLPDDGRDLTNELAVAIADRTEGMPPGLIIATAYVVSQLTRQQQLLFLKAGQVRIALTPDQLHNPTGTLH